MFDTVLIDIGIGLAVVFFVVATMVSALNEWVTRMLDIRAKVLWKALANTIDRDHGEPFTLGFWETVTWWRVGRDPRPAVTGDETGTLTGRLANLPLVRSLGGVTGSERTKVDQIAATTFSRGLLALADPAGGENQVGALRELTKDTPLGEVVASAGNGIDDVLEAVNIWFDAYMSRLSELYKIASRKVLAVAGLVLAVVFNVNAIDLVGDLQSDAELRSALVAAAGACAPDGAAGEDTSDIERCAEDITTALGDEAEEQVSLPLVGDYRWPGEALTDAGAGGPLVVVLGWGLTGVAVSFGATFWFGVVQRLTSYRRAGSAD